MVIPNPMEIPDGRMAIGGKKEVTQKLLTAGGTKTTPAKKKMIA